MTARDLPPPTADASLLDWLLVALRPTNRTRVKQLLKHGCVLVNGTPVTRFDHPLKPGDRVALAREGQPPGGRTQDPDAVGIIHEDDAVIVIHKPPGLLTVATESEKTDTAFVRLHAHLMERRAGRPFVVHRLDRDTSGLLLFARSPEVRDRLQENWDAVEKTYQAIVEGTPSPAEGVVENFLAEVGQHRVRACREVDDGAKRAVSRYRVAASRGGFSRVEVDLVTGRKHQIRVHLAGLGCPVIGDKAYGAKTDPAGRLGLHAWRLAFDHPVTGKRIAVESPVPAVLRRVLGG